MPNSNKLYIRVHFSDKNTGHNVSNAILIISWTAYINQLYNENKKSNDFSELEIHLECF